MFDVGFSELVVIGVIALLVFGPEDLPRVARTVGHLLGKLRRYVADVKSEISREMESADLMRLKADVQESVQSIQTTVNEQARKLESEFHQVSSAVERDLASTEIDSSTVQQELTFESPAIGNVVQDISPEPGNELTDPNQLDLFARGDANCSNKRGQ